MPNNEQDPPSKMTAVAALYNRSVTDDLDIGRFGIDLVFNTTTAQLAASLRSGNMTSDAPPTPFAATNDDRTGYIRDRSELASDYFKGLNVVLAVTKPKTDDEVNNDISMVSPVYMRLATTNKLNLKVAMCSAGSDAWAYFVSGTSSNNTVLSEYSLTTQSADPHDLGDAAVNTPLAAWYDPNTGGRRLIYQLADNRNKLQEYNVMDEQKWTLDVGDVLKGTSISVVWYSAKVYLYYVDSDHKVRRAVRTGDNQWGPDTPVPGAPKVAPGGQLAVVNSAGVNHLFYQTGNTTDGIKHIRDTDFHKL